MSAATGDGAIRERMAHIESLLHEVLETADSRVRARTTEIVQGLMDLHSAALERMLAAIGDPKVIERLAHDDLVGSVLLLYGLHPIDLETRIQQALEQARPLLHSHGGNVELISLTDGIVRLRLLGSCHGCPSSALTLKSAIEDAIYAKAPDVNAIEVEGESATAVSRDVKMDLRVALPMVPA
jgi:Fe-S cluster biogenesis protein NfuA